MIHPNFTVAHKVASGYFVIALFSLVAIVYALGSLHAQSARSEQLIAVDFQAIGLLRTLRHNLLAQETLERQFDILRDPILLELLDDRRAEFTALWDEVSALPLKELDGWLPPLVQRYQSRSKLFRAGILQDQGDRKLEGEVVALRERLIGLFDQAAAERQREMDGTLTWFSRESGRAFQVTLLLTFLGITLSVPIAIAIITGIHRSVRTLTRAAKEIAAGSFDTPITLADRKDEFGVLAREFRDMGHKLRDLAQLRLDANPLTHLPGNQAIDRELENRLLAGQPFAHLYIDLDHFKAFNDRYGYRAGSDVIVRTGDLVRQAVARVCTPGDFVGHIGGDDFVVVTSAVERSEVLAQSLIENFDRMIPEFYSEEDRRAGHFTAQDRFGERRQFPILTISIAIVLSEHLDTPSPQAISRECVKMKEHIKALPGSNFLVDRRKIL